MSKIKAFVCSLVALVAWVGVAAAQDKITIGMASGVNQVTSLVAQARGFFKDEGLDVDIKPVPRGNIAIEAIVAGSMQFAESTDTGLLSAVSNGIPLVALGAGSRGFTGKLIAAPDMSAVNSIADLKGKRIGIQVGTGVYTVWLKLVKKRGLKPEDFRVSNVRVTDMPTAMASKGTFDAVFGWDPMMQRIVKAGFGKEVISAKQFQTMADITYPLLIVADRDYVAHNPGITQHLLNGYARADRWIQSNPDGALQIYLDYIHKAGAPLDKDMVRTMMYEVDKFTGVKFLPTDLAEITGTAEFLHSEGHLSSVPDVAKLIVPDFAAKADAAAAGK